MFLACRSLKTNCTAFLTTRCANYSCTGFLLWNTSLFLEIPQRFSKMDLLLSYKDSRITTQISAKVTMHGGQYKHFAFSDFWLERSYLSKMTLVNVFILSEGSSQRVDYIAINTTGAASFRTIQILEKWQGYTGQQTWKSIWEERETSSVFVGLAAHSADTDQVHTWTCPRNPGLTDTHQTSQAQPSKMTFLVGQKWRRKSDFCSMETEISMLSFQRIFLSLQARNLPSVYYSKIPNSQCCSEN